MIMISDNALLDNLDRIRTTVLGIKRIKQNLDLKSDDAVIWCRQRIMQADSIIKKGKNWYVYSDDFIITVNAYSYTIITAHKRNKP